MYEYRRQLLSKGGNRLSPSWVAPKTPFCVSILTVGWMVAGTLDKTASMEGSLLLYDV